jgi:hypothetical protein
MRFVVSNPSSLLIHGRKKKVNFGGKYSLGTVTPGLLLGRKQMFPLVHASLKDGITLAITEVEYFAL